MIERTQLFCVSKLISCGLAFLLAACSNTVNGSVGGPEAGLSGDASVALAFQADKKFADYLSRDDRRRLSQAEQRALDYGKPSEAIEWRSEKSDVRGKVVALQFFRVSGSSCRQVTHEVSTGTEMSNTKLTACKSENGTWRLIR